MNEPKSQSNYNLEWREYLLVFRWNKCISLILLNMFQYRFNQNKITLNNII